MVAFPEQVTLGTVNKFKSLLAPVLVDIYKLIWATPDKDEEERELDPDAASSADEVTVLFPSIIPSSTMEKLFLSQILKYDAYKTYLHDSLHIPVRDMEKTFSFEEGQAAPAQKAMLPPPAKKRREEAPSQAES